MSERPEHSPTPPAGAERAPVVVLVAPQLGENIGAAARAMANFGLHALRLVTPRDPWPNEKAEKAASGAAFILSNARLCASTAEAIGDLAWVCATTARPRDMAKPILTPETAAREMRRRAAQGEPCGILFGRESSGLTNDEIALADAVAMAPVDPAFASLNLAQAVLLMAYEWARQGGKDALRLGRQTAYDGPAREGLFLRGSRPASKAELMGLFEHLEGELDAAGFLYPPEKRPLMVRNIRTMFTRMAPSEQEVRTLRGIVAALARAHRRKGGAS